MFSEHISEKEHGDFSSVNVRKRRDEECHLCETIDYDEDHVMAIGEG
jgi:hypothetical protein